MFNFFCIIFAISFNYSFDLIGNFHVAQILIILLSLFFFLQKKEFNTDKLINNILFFGIVWLFSQGLSDYLNNSEFKDYSRGFAKILITILGFYVFFNIANKKENGLIKILFWLSIIKLLFISFEINSLDSLKYHWKMGGGKYLTLLILLYTFFRAKSDNNNFLIFSLIFISILSLYLETRYLFLFNFSCAILIMFINRLKKFNLIFVSTFLVLIIFLSQQIVLNTNLLPERLINKNISQQGKYGFLIGGRSDMVAGAKAIIDKPIIGHGSWATNCEYADFLKDFLLANEYHKIFRDKNCLIPGHSVVLEAWIYSGFLGLVFWLFIIKSLISNINLNLHNAKNNYFPILIYLNIIVFWDLLFSPYGGLRIVELPLYLSILLFNNKKNYNL